MAHQKHRSQEEEQTRQVETLEKKLRKREKHLQELLEEARETRAKALQRFKRAETRLQKCTVSVERLEGRLAITRQQRAGLANHAQLSQEGASSDGSSEVLSRAATTVAPASCRSVDHSVPCQSPRRNRVSRA